MSRIVSCLAAIALLGLVPGAARAGEPLLHLERRAGMVATADATTTVSVWADGTVLVHVPAYLKRSGDFRSRLSERELAELLSRIGEQHLGEISAAGVASAKKRAAVSRRQRAGAGQAQITRVVTDPDAVTLTLRLSQGPTRTTTPQTISYVGVHNDAVAWPEVGELARLDTAVREIAALANRADLEKLP